MYRGYALGTSLGGRNHIYLAISGRAAGPFLIRRPNHFDRVLRPISPQNDRIIRAEPGVGFCQPIAGRTINGWVCHTEGNVAAKLIICKYLGDFRRNGPYIVGVCCAANHRNRQGGEQFRLHHGVIASTWLGSWDWVQRTGSPPTSHRRMAISGPARIQSSGNSETILPRQNYRKSIQSQQDRDLPRRHCLQIARGTVVRTSTPTGPKNGVRYKTPPAPSSQSLAAYIACTAR